MLGLPPRTGVAETRSASMTSAAASGRFSCARAEIRRAARPAAYGAAMLVPNFTSSPVFQRGTVEYAIPGTTTSGFVVSPPRALNHATTSEAGGSRGSGLRRKAPGTRAPTDSARPGEAGKPIVERAGAAGPAALAETPAGS